MDIVPVMFAKAKDVQPYLLGQFNRFEPILQSLRWTDHPACVRIGVNSAKE